MAITDPSKAAELLHLVMANQLNILLHQGHMIINTMYIPRFFGHTATLDAYDEDAQKGNSNGPIPGKDVRYYFFLGKEEAMTRFVLSSTAEPYMRVSGKPVEGEDIKKFSAQGYKNVLRGSHRAADVLGFAAHVAMTGLGLNNAAGDIERNPLLYLMDAYNKGLTKVDQYGEVDSFAYNALFDLAFKRSNAEFSNKNSFSYMNEKVEFVAFRQNEHLLGLRAKVSPQGDYVRGLSAEFEAKTGQVPTGSYTIDGKSFDASTLRSVQYSNGPLEVSQFFTIYDDQQRIAYVFHMLYRVLMTFSSNPRYTFKTCVDHGGVALDYDAIYKHYSN